jgi:hypothetical protein
MHGARPRSRCMTPFSESDFIAQALPNSNKLHGHFNQASSWRHSSGPELRCFVEMMPLVSFII